MSNLKIFNGPKPGPDSRGPDAGIHSSNHPEHTNQEPDKTYAHDNTPARQREFESQGHQTRAMVASHADEQGGHWHSWQSGGQGPGAGPANHSTGGDTGQNGFGLRLNLGPGIRGSHGEGNQPHASQPEGSASFRGSANSQEGIFNGQRSSERNLLPDTLGSARRALEQTVRTVSDQLRDGGHYGQRSTSGLENQADNYGERLLSANHALENRFGRGSQPAKDVGHYEQRSMAGLANQADNYGERLISATNYAVENRFGHGSRPERAVREIISNVASISQLDKYFSLLEKTGGEPVRRTYRAAMDFLLGQERRSGGQDQLRFANDLLHDLQNGLFLFREDLEGPFPLTGRARIVSEMIALMRTLDAIEAFENANTANGDYNLPALLTGAGLTGSELTALLEQLLTDSRPLLPGLAGRLEIPRIVAALGGLLNDADGKPLLMVDGKPLKAGDLVWLNTLATNSGWVVDRSASRMAPALTYGFDSIFSLIGFDGRSLALPRFLAIQSQVNAFEFEWVFGQAPLSESWIRSAIELLKDSRIFEHNVLGEMLEEALTTGRFHMAVMRGTVEDGKPVNGSYSLSTAWNPSSSLNPSLNTAAG